MITFSYLATLMRVHEQVEKAELVEQLDDTGSDEKQEYLAEENEGEHCPTRPPRNRRRRTTRTSSRSRTRSIGGGRQGKKATVMQMAHAMELLVVMGAHPISSTGRTCDARSATRASTRVQRARY